MRVSEAVVERLSEHGISTVFGNPGKQSLPLNKAIDGLDDIEFVVARHETAVSHEAWGYAETSGEMAATIVIPGPGDMNAMNGLKNALNDCTPLLHLAIETEPEIRGGDGIHETPPDTYDNVVKENILVETPESTIAEVSQAIETAQTHPKGPVRVGIPKNFLKMDVRLGERERGETDGRPSPSDSTVQQAVTLLDEAERPVIVAGGGVRSAAASEDVRTLAAQIDAPVISTYKGKGTIPADDPMFAGVLYGGSPPAVTDCLGEADVILGMGTDFDAVATGAWSVEMPGELIHVTLHPSDLGVGYDPAVGIVADAKETAQRLVSECASMSRGGRERAASIRAAIDGHLQPLRERTDLPMTSVAALSSVNETLPDDTIIAVDAGGFRLWAIMAVDAYGPRRYVNPGSWASMGTGLPSGIGATLANPDENVVVLTGDGGLMMCLHELHTAVVHDLDLTVVVFNNNDYAIISEEAKRNYGLDDDPYNWVDAPISFTAIAAGVGMDATKIESANEIGDAIERSFRTDGPSLIEIPTDPNEPQASVWDGSWDSAESS